MIGCLKLRIKKRSFTKLQANKNVLARNIIFLFIYLCYYPSFVTRIVSIPYWSSICNATICASAFFFLAVMLVQKRINKYIVVSCILYIFLNTATLLAGRTGDLSASTLRMIRCISFLLTTEYLIQFYSPQKALPVLMFVMEIINYANFASMLVYPNGMYHTEWINGQDIAVKSLPGYVRTNERVHWLMGHQSITIRFILPAMCIAILYDLVCKNSSALKTLHSKNTLGIRSIALFCVCLGELLFSSSGGNYIVTILFFLLVFLMKRGVRIKTWWLLCSVVLFYSISSLLAQSAIFNLVGMLVGRSVDLISRCRTWDAVLVSCSKKLFLGYGYVNESSFSLRHLMNNYGNPHSDYLWVLFEGGLVALVVFALLLFIIGRRSEKVRNPIELYTYVAFICFIVMMLDDDHIFRSQYMLVIPSLCYHAPAIYRAITNQRREVCSLDEK